MPNKVAEDMQERLAALRSAAQTQQRARSAILARLRGSLADLAAQRSRLRGARGRQDGAGSGSKGSLASRYGFTPRESEVALLLAEGASNAVIAEVLAISEHTARHHTRHVLAKLSVHSRARVASLVYRDTARREGKPEPL